MRLKLYTAAAFISFTVLSSCSGNKDKDYSDKSLVSPATGNETTLAVAPDTTITQTSKTLPAATTTVPGTNPVNLAPQNRSVNFLPANTQPANVTTQTAPMTINPQQAQQTTTAPGMNPPHGQPNHRCDIAVGAPLNSKPAPPATTQTTAATTQPAPVTINPQQVQQTTTTAPGMNPPHGQPNHRCDIAVGAPLNSPPAAKQTVIPAVIAAPKTDSTKN
jgi:hypothetical protein